MKRNDLNVGELSHFEWWTEMNSPPSLDTTLPHPPALCSGLGWTSRDAALTQTGTALWDLTSCRRGRKAWPGRLWRSSAGSALCTSASTNKRGQHLAVRMTVLFFCLQSSQEPGHFNHGHIKKELLSMRMHLVTSIKDKFNLVLQVKSSTFQIPTIGCRIMEKWNAWMGQQLGKGKLRMKCFPVITFFSALEINVLELNTVTQNLRLFAGTSSPHSCSTWGSSWTQWSWAPLAFLWKHHLTCSSRW